MEDKHHAGRLFYFLVGGLMGAGAGMLLAPGAGRAIRESVRRRTQETRELAGEWRDRILRRGAEIGAGVGHRLSSAGAALAGSMESRLGRHNGPTASS
jgi:gas vesicle protein